VENGRGETQVMGIRSLTTGIARTGSQPAPSRPRAAVGASPSSHQSLIRSGRHGIAACLASGFAGNLAPVKEAVGSIPSNMTLTLPN
jgi:hypothetical protein